MKKIASLGFVLLVAAMATAQKQSKMKYPKVKTDATTETFFGTQVQDPYRWLENPDDEATKKFVTEQNIVSYGYLEQIPYRSKIQKRLEALWNYERISAPFKEGDYWYFYKNNGLQNQSVLYSSLNQGGEKAEIVLNPNDFSKDGTVSLSGTFFSKDGRYLAYAVQDGGSDWSKIQVRDVVTKQNLKDEVNWVKFSGASWLKDGFFYSRYANADKGNKLAQKNEFHQVYFHKLGTPQSEDKLVHEDQKSPTKNFNISVSNDETFAYLTSTTSTTGNTLAFRKTDKNGEFETLVDGYEFDYDVIGNHGDTLFVITNENAPNYKLIAIDARQPQKAKWFEIIPQTENVLAGVSIINRRLVANYIVDASSRVLLFDYKGSKTGEITLPELGNVGGLSGKHDSNIAFLSFSSFTRPNTIYRLDMDQLKPETALHFQPKLAFNPADFVTKQVFYTSKDGTKVPMFIVHKKGLVPNGQTPTLLYGYGGFNISVMPSYKIPVIHLLEQGGIYAVANIRGGGEYGSKWHKAGVLQKKQNVFDDFIAAAEYLISNKYTNNKNIAIEGRSNGGLLVGACMTQRPDLFAVAFPGVGVLDMLRYQNFTIGWAWKDDYGQSTDSKEMFQYLYKYSPVHNCKEANYPATLVITADHDDRVVPAHSYKFISALQKAQKGTLPTIIRIDVRAGHGAGKPTSMTILEEADKLAFMFNNVQSKIYK